MNDSDDSDDSDELDDSDDSEATARGGLPKDSDGADVATRFDSDRRSFDHSGPTRISRLGFPSQGMGEPSPSESDSLRASPTRRADSVRVGASSPPARHSSARTRAGPRAARTPERARSPDAVLRRLPEIIGDYRRLSEVISALSVTVGAAPSEINRRLAVSAIFDPGTARAARPCRYPMGRLRCRRLSEIIEDYGIEVVRLSEIIGGAAPVIRRLAIPAFPSIFLSVRVGDRPLSESVTRISRTARFQKN